MTFKLFVLVALLVAFVSAESLVKTIESDKDWATISQGPVLIKFYAGWCPHCKAYAPTFELAAGILENSEVAVYEINCEDFEGLCKKETVAAYPTTRYYQDGQAVDYSGGRDADGIAMWAKRLAGPDLVALEATKVDAATAGEDCYFVVNLETGPELLDMLRQSANVFKAQVQTIGLSHDDFLARYPGQEDTALVAVREGQVVGFDGNVHPKEILAFFDRYRFPTLPALGPDNFSSLAQTPGRRMMIACVHPDDEDFRPAMKALMPSLEDRYVGCWLDGIAWEAFVGRYEITEEDLPAVLVLDVYTQRYNAIKSGDTDEIATWLGELAEGTIEMLPLPGARPPIKQWQAVLVYVLSVVIYYRKLAAVIGATLIVAIAFILIRVIRKRSAKKAARAEEKKEEEKAGSEAYKEEETAKDK